MADATSHQNHEQRLIADLEGLGADASNAIGVHLRLSGLRPEHRAAFQKRLVLESLQLGIERHKGRVYQIFSGDLVLILFGADEAAANAMCGAVRRLFATDPISDTARASEIGRLTETYPLKAELDAFKQLAARLAADAKADREAADAGEIPRPSEPFEARHVPQMINALGGADLGEMVRRQAICAMVGCNPPQPVILELAVDFDRLGAQLLPNVNLDANRWYRRALDDLVLERLLAWFGKENFSGGSNTVSIDVSLASLMSDTFLDFDRSTSEQWRNRLIFELQEADLFADLGAATFLRDYLQARGYRLAIDGVNHLTLPMIDRKWLNIDFLKLRWGPDYETEIVGQQRKALAKAIERSGHASVILYDCVSARAVSVGQELGINLFQGPYIESLLRFANKSKPAAKPETKAKATAKATATTKA